MLQKILHFIKYNNVFTIIFTLCFLGFGGAFAASPEMRASVYSSAESVVSVDNGLIISADLDNFDFSLRIRSVTEDQENYYVVYTYRTLAVEDSIWQEIEMEKTLTVSKEALDGRDLGLHVAEELGENINYELSYLKRVQELEKKRGESQKVVTVEYSGLIGKLLNPKEKVIEGYNPVIPEPKIIEEVPANIESNPSEVVVSVPYSESSESSESEETSASQPSDNISSPITAEEQSQALADASSTPSVESADNQEAATNETEPQTESEQEQISTSTPAQIEPEQESTPDSLPAPEEMINEELIQEVVEELLQNEPSPVQTPESAVPAIEPTAPAPEPTSEPTQ